LVNHSYHCNVRYARKTKFLISQHIFHFRTHKNDNLPPHHICTLARKEDSGGNEEMPQAFSSLLAA